MGRLLFVDVIGGAAGDMLLAALIDAGAPLEAVRSAVEAVLPGTFDLGIEEVRRAGLRAAHLSIRRADGAPADPLTPRPLGALTDAVDRAPLPDPVRARASEVLRRLGEAEARVHGIAVDDLHLHELGDDDTLLDVVGIVTGLHTLAIDRMLVSPIPLGLAAPADRSPGHGSIPTPGPVTVDLLRGFGIRGGWAGETVTPTAAAVLAALGAPAGEMPAMTLEAVGYGAGTDDPSAVPNVVRVVVGSDRAATTGDGPSTRELVLLEANLDDLTPELTADAARALLAAGALDVWTTPVGMKKGRPGLVVSALCEPPSEDRITRAFFEQTTTFGVRASRVRRAELERRVVALPVAGGEVRAKVGVLSGRVVTATPEHDDVAALAERLGRPVREVYAEAAVAARSVLAQEIAR
jgi:pyridinium-3,5-bisthiocarboxylic acid mononucleotide nickel chelatase